ncbi:hypothetical protein Leryth_002419 [Lithospermum erythrorhizon]|nr:hypothetical protein Leryth_002419 [Lithospermum erythrorhizon]
MLPCLGPSSSAAKANSYTSPATSLGYSVNNTPISSALTSPTGYLTREYTLVVNGPSYGEIWNVIHPNSDSEHNVELEQVDFYEDPEFLWQVLQPSHSHVEEALSLIIPDAFTKLIASYFEHSENTSRMCLFLYQSVHRARLLYIPLYNLLDVLSPDIGNGSHFINQSQCDWAFNVFLQYDSLTNPLPPSDSHNFDDIRGCFSELRQELDQHLHKSHTKSHVSNGSALSLVAAGLGAAMSSVMVASRALVSLASPVCPKCMPSKVTKEEVTHLSHLDAAAKGTYVLHHYLETIDRLVTRLYSAIENDKLLIRLGLERGRDIYPIQEIIRQLRKTLPNFLNQLTDLEEHICLCFATINRARKLLLDEIYFQGMREP